MLAHGAENLPAFNALPEHKELPDPFVMMDGARVITAQEWNEKRRPELKQLFQHYMYGYAPEPVPIHSELETPETEILGGNGVLRQVVISFPTLPEHAPRIHLALFLPKAANGPVPVFIAMNKCGNYTVLDDEAILIDPTAYVHDQCPGPPETARGKDKDFWCVPYLVERGYAFATYHESNIDPDKDDFTDGIHPFFPDLKCPDESRWGTIAAWAWGIQRCVDYLASAPGIDKGKICVTGHSRRGKTALLAGAFDERIALVVPHQSGTGGAALSRDNDQETVERINRVFPHWFNDVYPKFGSGNEAKLPMDQHLLMALVAPRPLLDTMGLQDKWANYDSSLRAIHAAAPVWALLGGKGMVGDGVLTDPQEVAKENAGSLLQYRRDTKHTMDQGYWKAILDFADIQFGRVSAVR
ncbi:MAG: acetylxylan esterase [Candidatus Hydrogenedentes bacterium]|nr:acetylxylan esterase [Candidatus Hydrogenedentota bacterium]